MIGVGPLIQNRVETDPSLSEGPYAAQLRLKGAAERCGIGEDSPSSAALTEYMDPPLDKTPALGGIAIDSALLTEAGALHSTCIGSLCTLHGLDILSPG